MRVLLLLLLFANTPCLAAKLFECRDAQGRISFVDHGCEGAAAQREIAIVVAGKSAKSAPADADTRQIQAWDKASRARLPASLGGRANAMRSRTGAQRVASNKQPDACAQARATQDRAHRERSFSMSFDDRRKLSDAVLSACGLH